MCLDTTSSHTRFTFIHLTASYTRDYTGYVGHVRHAVRRSKNRRWLVWLECVKFSLHEKWNILTWLSAPNERNMSDRRKIQPRAWSPPGLITLGLDHPWAWSPMSLIIPGLDHPWAWSPPVLITPWLDHLAGFKLYNLFMHSHIRMIGSVQLQVSLLRQRFCLHISTCMARELR